MCLWVRSALSVFLFSISRVEEIKLGSLLKRLHLRYRVFWKAARHLTGKQISTFAPQENFFVIRKRFKRKTSVYARIWIPFWPNKAKIKDHKNFPGSPILAGAISCVDHWIPRENVYIVWSVAFTGRNRSSSDNLLNSKWPKWRWPCPCMKIEANAYSVSKRCADRLSKRLSMYRNLSLIHLSYNKNFFLHLVQIATKKFYQAQFVARLSTNIYFGGI